MMTATDSGKQKACGPDKVFANSGTIGQDDCAVQLRNLTNKSYSTYSVWNPRAYVCDDARNKLAEFAACHGNLHYKQGSGNVDACVVDEDSELRTMKFTATERKRNQLFPREFRANPGMANGDFLPEIDSQLTRGAVQQRERRVLHSSEDCAHISEYEANNNFIPLIPCLQKSVQDPAHIVPQWINGGVPSRILVRSPEYCAAQQKQNVP